MVSMNDPFHLFADPLYKLESDYASPLYFLLSDFFFFFVKIFLSYYVLEGPLVFYDKCRNCCKGDTRESNGRCSFEVGFNSICCAGCLSCSLWR